MASVSRAFLFALSAAAAATVPVDGTSEEVFQVTGTFVHYLQGQAAIEGRDIGEIRPLADRAPFPAWKAGQTLQTGAGLAEVLLEPGIVARLAENTAVKLAESAPGKAILDLASGSLAIEILIPKPGLTVRHRGGTLSPKKEGRYWIGDGPEDNALTRWSARRSEILAAANLDSAREIAANQTPLRNAVWWWNANHGTLTFLPPRGTACGGSDTCYLSPRQASRRRDPGPVAPIDFAPGPAWLPPIVAQSK